MSELTWRRPWREYVRRSCSTRSALSANEPVTSRQCVSQNSMDKIVCISTPVSMPRVLFDYGMRVLCPLTLRRRANRFWKRKHASSLLTSRQPHLNQTGAHAALLLDTFQTLIHYASACPIRHIVQILEGLVSNLYVAYT